MRMGFRNSNGRSAVHTLFARPLWLAAGAALLLAGCQTQQPATMAAQPRGATVAFDSIDGLPPQHFQTLVADLNQEAQSRSVAVTSRLQPSAYRVRGYFAASVDKSHTTTVSWVWDVFDRDERRAMRISGSAPVKGRDWNAADPALMQKIARSSMDELAGFLNSPAVAPAAPLAAPTGPALALTTDGSPEAAGIFRVAHTDPVPGNGSTAKQAGR
jgi:hypothetical protein